MAPPRIRWRHNAPSRPKPHPLTTARWFSRLCRNHHQHQHLIIPALTLVESSSTLHHTYFLKSQNHNHHSPSLVYPTTILNSFSKVATTPSQRTSTPIITALEAVWYFIPRFNWRSSLSWSLWSSRSTWFSWSPHFPPAWLSPSSQL